MREIMASFSEAVFGWDDSHNYAHTEAKYTGIMPVLFCGKCKITYFTGKCHLSHLSFFFSDASSRMLRSGWLWRIGRSAEWRDGEIQNDDSIPYVYRYYYYCWWMNSNAVLDLLTSWLNCLSTVFHGIRLKDPEKWTCTSGLWGCMLQQVRLGFRFWKKK